MDIVDRLRCILKGNRVAQDAADEIIRLRAALTELERACEHRASLLPRDVYVITEAVPGMRDALTALDDARREAKHALTPNALAQGPGVSSPGPAGAMGYTAGTTE